VDEKAGEGKTGPNEGEFSQVRSGKEAILWGVLNLARKRGFLEHRSAEVDHATLQALFRRR